jgi:hypothetical protein
MRSNKAGKPGGALEKMAMAGAIAKDLNGAFALEGGHAVDTEA